MQIPSPCLILVAAASEAKAVARAVPGSTPPTDDWRPVPLTPGDTVYLARTGVGKVNAASAAIYLTRPPARYASVLSLGIGGALPALDAAPALALGTVALGIAGIYADEGVQTPERFLDISEVGFPPGGDAPRPMFRGSRITGDAALRSACRSALAAAGLDPVEADIATVSTCSGTDALARAVAQRTGAAVEAMEGAAIAHALGRVPGPEQPRPFCEIRVVSNTTGDRARQVWDIPRALSRLTEVAAALLLAAAEASDSSRARAG